MKISKLNEYADDLNATLHRIEIRARVGRKQSLLSMRNALQEIIADAQECLKK